jgi:hypothetical protein
MSNTCSNGLTYAHLKLTHLEFKLRFDLPRYMEYFINRTARKIQYEKQKEDARKLNMEYRSYYDEAPVLTFEQWLIADKSPKIGIVSPDIYDQCKDELSSKRYWGYSPGFSLHRSELLPPKTALIIHSRDLGEIPLKSPFIVKIFPNT